ncbi:hypothetical protein SAMN04490203_2540 [Pseudomonas taetrolens]|uniref:Lipoprotein n=1 Tax=Pseudomonas taetrolens TaxID=47884 RepID=A0A0J6GID8_PSETA|nr:lipoprotein [Pseudomonas taetrolens]KMM84441.1 lipoprotein [Pseudomonas taetrolens]SEC50522.1 hypothetical protein SAMN04490203_2540 [Pseudomonas taetrolens]SQF86691.1 putative lipoprotein [Pseudomonas taetrolens]VEH49767.1 putative lipoprotein [Pseudomonas taetrolens]
MKLLLIGMAVILAGCAGREPEVRTVRIEVPVLVSCYTPEVEVEVPHWTAASLKKSDSLEVKVRALLAERRQRMGYERELVAASTACR